MPGRGMVQNRVNRPFFALPRKEIFDLKALGQALQNPTQRAGLARWLQSELHQVEMGVRTFAANLLQPGRTGQHNIREAARRVIHKNIVAHHQVGLG